MFVKSFKTRFSKNKLKLFVSNFKDDWKSLV